MAISAGRLAVVFGNAGPGHRVGGDLRACQGGPLYLFESDWIVDRGGLGRVERLSVATISPGGALAGVAAGRRVGSGRNHTCRRRLAADFLLAQYRDDLDAAASCTEQNAMAHYCLASIYTGQGRIEEAIGQIHEALATDSIARYATADSHVLLGECLMAKGKIDEALPHFEEATRITPDSERCHHRFAIALAYASEHDQAIAEFRKAVRLAPTSSQARIAWPMLCCPAETLAERLPNVARSSGRSPARSKQSQSWVGPWLPRAMSRKHSLICRKRWSSNHATRRPTSTWAWLSMVAGSHKPASLTSTRQLFFSPTASRCCGKRHGFW